MRKPTGYTPISPLDLATKSYVDNRRYMGGYSSDASVGSGSWIQPSNFISSVNANPTSTGATDFEPFDIGPGGMTIQSIGVTVSTALVAGSATVVCQLGLYPDDGSGAFPLFTNRLESGNITITATGRGVLTVSRTLTAGRYWGAFLYMVTSGTPTTAPQFSCINSAFGLGIPNSGIIGTAVRTIRILGQSTLPTTNQTLSINGANTAPVIALRLA